jgi:hypothetical protein
MKGEVALLAEPFRGVAEESRNLELSAFTFTQQ